MLWASTGYDRAVSRHVTIPSTSVRLALAGAIALLVGCPSGGGVAPTETPTPAASLPGGPQAGGPQTGGPQTGPDPAAVGLLLLHRGDFAGAEAPLEQALGKAPRDPRLLEAMGNLCGRTDRWQRAEGLYRAALEAEPGRISALLGLAMVQSDTGRYPEALATLDAVRQRDPGNLTAEVRRANLLQRTGQTAAAVEAALALIARHPEIAEVPFVLGLALEEQGDLEGAAAALERTVALQPDHLGAWSHLNAIATRRHRPKEAERAAAAHRKALDRRRIEERVRTHRMKGVEAFNHEDYTTALQEFGIIAREDPEDPQVHLYIGSALLAQGHLEEARASLAHSLRLQPRSERALTEMGRLEALQNHLDASVSALRQAIALNPEFPLPHYVLAGVLMARGETEASRAETRQFEALRARSQGGAMEFVDPSGKELP